MIALSAIVSCHCLLLTDALRLQSTRSATRTTGWAATPSSRMLRMPARRCGVTTSAGSELTGKCDHILFKEVTAAICGCAVV